ncbi:MAG: tRNA lysidine(34) synthetase TilS [Candidatus Merdivicinus sp.]
MSRKENRCLLEDAADLSLVRGKRVVAGLSGGADSAALVCYLWEQGIPVLAAHVNHSLRGEESDQDEEFVREFCRGLGIPLRVRRADIAALAREQGVGLEECGRRERYAFFEELRREWGGEGAVIATAHTLSDNLETILFRIARGTALEGLCGIPAVRGAVVRPLLGCTRRAVEDYCRRKGIRYVTDSTNADVSYARNRIRAQAVPALLAVNAAAEQNAARMLQSLGEDRDFLAEQAGALYRQSAGERGLSLEPLRDAHRSLLSRVIVRFLREHGTEPDYAVLAAAEQAVRTGEGAVNLPGGCRLRAAAGFLRLEEPFSGAEGFSAELPSAPEADGILAILPLPDGRMVRFQVQTAKDIESVKKIYKNDLIFCMDYDTIIGKLLFRNRLPGDRIGFAGRDGSRLLKKLYSEMGLTPRQRGSAWILADEAGVLWAEYAGLSRRAAPGPAAERILFSVWEGKQEGVRQDE